MEIGATEPVVRNFETSSFDFYKGSLYGALARSVGRHPELWALDYLDEKYTYQRLLQRVHDCAQAFKSFGICEGERISIMLPNCPQAVIALYAASKIGAIAAMVHPLISEKELQHSIKLTESSLLVAEDASYEKISVAMAKIEGEGGLTCPILLTSLTDELTEANRPAFHAQIEQKTLFSWERERREGIFVWANDVPINQWQSHDETSVENCTEEEDLSDKPAVILFSGGTTGGLKGVLLSNGNINASSAQQYLTTRDGLQPGECILVALPLFHGFGLATCLHSGIIHSLCCLLVPRVTSEDCKAIATAKKCNYIYGVPTLVDKLLRSLSPADRDLSFVKEVFIGGDALPHEMRTRFNHLLEECGSAARVRVGYGATELVAPFCVEPIQNSKEGCIGKLYFGNRCKVVDFETGDELPPYADGELLASGPTVMLGYWRNAEETAKVVAIDENGVRWFRTGDVVSVDEDGFLFYKGRIKRMIISNGYNVYPSLIEDVLNKSPLVKVSCVIGVPDQLCLQRVKAFVVLNEGVSPSEVVQNQLLDLLRKNVARYALPKEIVFEESLPTTKVGKIDYRALERDSGRCAEKACINE